MADMLTSPWWPGVYVDHLVAECPLMGSVPAVFGPIDPDGTDICGWCFRVWRARNRFTAASPEVRP